MIGQDHFGDFGSRELTKVSACKIGEAYAHPRRVLCDAILLRR